jgi:hypothetical protein
MRQRMPLVVVGALSVLALLAGCGGGGQSHILTTGQYAPIAAAPVIEGENKDPDQGAKSGLDVMVVTTSLGKGRFQLLVRNTSSIGFINTFRWVPPPNATITALTSVSTGNCRLLNGSISCRLVLRPPSCTCKGDGGSVKIRFTARIDLGGHGLTHGFQYGSLRVDSETPVPYIIPSSPDEKLSQVADLPFCDKGRSTTKAKPCIQHG